MAIMVYEVLYGSPTFGRNKETLKNDILEKQPNFSPELRSISNGTRAAPLSMHLLQLNVMCVCVTKWSGLKNDS
jgi:hypothetical protein